MGGVVLFTQPDWFTSNLWGVDQFCVGVSKQSFST